MQIHADNTSSSHRALDVRNSGGQIFGVFNDGKVGIGGTPSAPLDVVVTAGSNSKVAEFKDASGNGIEVAINNSSPFRHIVGVGGGEALAFATGGTTTERLIINSSGNIGIGTDSPAHLLDIKNSSGGASARIEAGTNESASLRLQNDAQEWDVNCQTVDHFAVFDQTGSAAAFLLTATNYFVSLPGVYSGTTSSAANVHINSGGSLLRVTSAKKYKEDIKDYKVGLDAVNQMNPVLYKSKKDMHNSADEKIDDKTYAGLLADDIHDLGLSEFVEYSEDGEVEGLFYERMVSVCINAIKELSAKVTELEKKCENCC